MRFGLSGKTNERKLINSSPINAYSFWRLTKFSHRCWCYFPPDSFISGTWMSVVTGCARLSETLCKFGEISFSTWLWKVVLQLLSKKPIQEFPIGWRVVRFCQQLGSKWCFTCGRLLQPVFGWLTSCGPSRGSSAVFSGVIFGREIKAERCILNQRCAKICFTIFDFKFQCVRNC